MDMKPSEKHSLHNHLLIFKQTTSPNKILCLVQVGPNMFIEEFSYPNPSQQLHPFSLQNNMCFQVHAFFCKGSPSCKSMMPPFFQRFWLLFFLKAVSHFCHFSNGCWLHNLFFKGYSTPFLQMFFAFSKQSATTFFPKAASNLFCKGCAYIPYPFLQRVFLLAFFPKEPPFFQRLPFLQSVNLFCCLDQLCP